MIEKIRMPISELKIFFEGIEIRAKEKFMISFYGKPDSLEKEIVKAVQKWTAKKEVSHIERSAVPAHGNVYDIGEGYVHIACLGQWSGTNEPLYYANKHCLELFVQEERFFLVDQHQEGRGRDMTITATLLCEVVVPEEYIPPTTENNFVQLEREVGCANVSGSYQEVDNSEEECREANGIPQHKHRSHDFWHPASRVHGREQKKD